MSRLTLVQFEGASGLAGATETWEAVEGAPRYLQIADVGIRPGFDAAWYDCALVSDRGEAIDDEFLIVVAFPVPADDLDEFDDWYETEHSPLLLEADGWNRVRRFAVEAHAGPAYTRFAVHSLSTLSALDSPARARAQQGPKRAAVAAHPWYSQSGRWYYRRANELDTEA